MYNNQDYHYRAASPTPPTRKPRSGAGKKALLVLLCLFLAVAAGFTGGYIANMNRPAPAIEGAAPAIAQPETPFPEGPGLPAFESAEPAPDIVTSSNLISSSGGQAMTVPEVAAAVRQSVVEIKTETVRAGAWGAGTYVSEGAGSGVIISEDGYIITNNHVISARQALPCVWSTGANFPPRLSRLTRERTSL